MARIEPLRQHRLTMLEITRAVPLGGRTVRLTLSDGSIVERDPTDLLDGPAFERIARDDGAFRQVRAHQGTIVWPVTWTSPQRR